ncbi:MAG: Flp pilus assembly protein CpaB, partial [Candidatus Omnitrophica bacterium]|nr:Flp pilus assembly protein CpaB [Candidatus Omnitrophota bacterium]
MQKQKIIIIAGAILALMAVFMTKAYIDQERQKVFAEAKKKIAGMQANISKNQSQVLMATRDIPKGSTIAEDSVEVKVIPDQYRQPQAVTSIGRVMGMVTIASIAKGEQIILTKLVQSRQLGGLAEGTPIGKRAITISVDNLASLAGMINPGDYVDVIAMVAVPVQTAEGKQSSQI